MQAPHRTRAPARPVTPAAPATPVDAARQDRFLRQLVPPAWDEVDEPDDREATDASWFDAPVDAVDDGRGDGSSPQGDDGRQDDEEPAAEPPAPPPAAAAFQELAPWACVQAPGRLPGDHAGTLAPSVPAASSAKDAAWLGEIVEQVGQLTAGSDARFQHWSVTVPLDPQSLPDCELRITLSPGSMVLRFRTGTAESAHLVSRHRDTLRARLEALPSSPSAIDIDLE